MSQTDAELIAACQAMDEVSEELHAAGAYEPDGADVLDSPENLADETNITRLVIEQSRHLDRIRRMKVTTIEGARAFAWAVLRRSPELLTDRDLDAGLRMLLVKLTAPEL